MDASAFFQWLCQKYPAIVVHSTEEKARSLEENGQTKKIPVDTRLPNPNRTEFDNLYLDMDGIIHLCCHPEGKPAPKNENEMMVSIYEYIDRLFSIVRPRRLLYLAMDGVAPRAKMNQQRSQRLQASKEESDMREEIAKVKKALRAKGLLVLPDKPAEEQFDSNCITPGTKFMHRISVFLRYFINYKLNTDPGWENVAVILSDANVPGEGKQKIMDYIRRQRAQPNHDPNTRHCLYGSDADLVMLGLATHEVNFTIIREEFKPNQETMCQVCGQHGHVFKECMGLAKEEQTKPIQEEPAFIFLKLSILREYLNHDFNMPGLPFPLDLERAIDDWVLICFLVGNDFLPPLPSLEMREGAMDMLLRLYKKAVYKTGGGYLTISGIVNLQRLQVLLKDLGELEPQIFKKRRETDLILKQRDAQEQKRQKRMNKPRLEGRQHSSTALFKSSSGLPLNNPHQFMEEEEEKVDTVDRIQLWEDGYQQRYFKRKFGIRAKDHEFRTKITNEYIKGICWVMKYYYQGCASWSWYFPYHCAPFASDFINIGNGSIQFQSNSSEQVHPDLTEYEMKLNVHGNDRLFVGRRYPAQDFLRALYEQGSSVPHAQINPKLTSGIRGTVWCDEMVISPGDVVQSPVPQMENNPATCVQYENPRYDAGYIFSARRHKGATVPRPMLRLDDLNRRYSVQSCHDRGSTNKLINSLQTTPVISEYSHLSHKSPLMKVESMYHSGPTEGYGGGGERFTAPYQRRDGGNGDGRHREGSRYTVSRDGHRSHCGASSGSSRQQRSKPY